MPVAHLGVGASSRATAEEIRDLVDTVLAQGGTGWEAVGSIATTEVLAGDPRLGRLGLPVVGFAAGVLAAVTDVAPSARAQAEIGVGSVAEAAALLAAGPGARLVVRKARSAHATAALASQ